MRILASPYWGALLDLSANVKAWTQDSAGTQRRLNNSAAPLHALADKINHMLARNARVVFGQGWREGCWDQRGAAPLVAFLVNDLVNNARNFTVHVLAMPRVVAATGSSTAQIDGYGGPSTVNLSGSVDVTPGPAWPESLIYCTIRVPRGGAAANWVEDTLTTLDGFTIVDISVQEDQLAELDTTLHTYSLPSSVATGEDVIQGVRGLDACLTPFHTFRSTSLSADIYWAANGTDEGWANDSVPATTETPPLQAPLGAGGDQRGMRIDSSTFVNVIDQAVTARSDSSPGISCPAFRCGVGDETADLGISAYLSVAVFASAVGEVAATVRFQGPDHVADNYVDVSVPVSATPAWCYGTGVVRLSAGELDDDATSHRNKIDILAKSDVGGVLFIYGLHGSRVYEPPA